MNGKQPAFRFGNPAQSSFQYLEDLATAYWYSEVLFASIELRLFDNIESGWLGTDELAELSGCRFEPLGRLLRVLRDMALVHSEKGLWFNDQLSRRYLLSASSEYMGDFLLYRRYMRPRWETIVERTAREPSKILEARPLPQDDYELRNFYYVRAVDGLARRKAKEIRAILDLVDWRTPMLDFGSGAGALSRELASSRPESFAVLADLPEVFDAARRIHNSPAPSRRLYPVGCDVRRPPFRNGAFGTVIMSNILHAYDEVTAEGLLKQGLALLATDGLLVVHDYFPDRAGGVSAPRGSLQDLNMMLNTYNGACHDSETVLEWLGKAGFGETRVRDLPSDSSIIVARRGTTPDPGEWIDRARRLGFDRAVEIEAGSVETAPWVRAKCRFGCDGYGRNLRCPPDSPNHTETKALIQSYEKALLVVGQPPGREFHRKLLNLEKEAFLAGYHKALAFGAGPCPVCDGCPEDGPCRFPSKARPSMEASGIDVYATARKAGLLLEPVREKDAYATYVGLLLIE